MFAQNQQNALPTMGNVGVGTTSPDVKLQVNEETTGFSDWVLEQEKVKIYPNPSNATVNIEVIENETSSFFYAVYDISGKLISSQNVQGKVTRLTLERGVYFVQLKINEFGFQF